MGHGAVPSTAFHCRVGLWLVVLGVGVAAAVLPVVAVAPNIALVIVVAAAVNIVAVAESARLLTMCLCSHML